MKDYIAAAVDELYELGIREVVISPGSRSTSLSMLFCEHHFQVYLNIDERCAGFFALGIAKEKQRPVVLVCTSGSAPSHYFPAVTEAYHSRIPLLLLIADRPPELRNVGAPQTIPQERMFGVFIKYYEELAISEYNSCQYSRNVMRKAYMQCAEGKRGPVQINVPLREPLVPVLGTESFQMGRNRESFSYIEGEREAFFDASLLEDKKGIIICGPDADADYHKEVLCTAKQLNTPILADPLSNMRNYNSSYIIESYDAFLKSDEIKQELKPEYMIMLGQIPVSKRLQQFIEASHDVFIIQIDKQAEYRNPALNTSLYLQTSPKNLFKNMSITNADDTYLNEWRRLQDIMRKQLKRAYSEEKFFEGKVVQILQEILPKQSRLMVANSMSIRDVDYFFEAKKQQIKVLCNRGTNGIDGTISTALGVSTAGYPVTLLTGDLAFFHDMNGLLIGKTHSLKLIILLLNNNGGGIFQYLPQRGEKYFEYLFCTPHGINFEGIKTLYGINYYKAKDYEELKELYGACLHFNGISVIEINTEMELSKKLHDQYTTLEHICL
jgi:2-succinyl-5-enolpyruvyl-6-hydroxy-3-cyclohexene-1-carboxylate synthase